MVNPAALNKKKKDSVDLDSDALSDTDSIHPKDMNNIVKDKDANKPPDSRSTNMKMRVREWAETSSCHAVPHLASASTKFAIVVWTAILIFCIIAFIVLFGITVIQFFSFERINKMNLGTSSTNFPSLTFCNINPYKLSALQKSELFNAIMEIFKNG